MDDRYALFLFYSNICRYFSGNCANGKCSLVKKHTEHFQTVGDFSIVLNVKAQENHMNKYLSNCEDIQGDIAFNCDELNSFSDSGNCQLGKVSKNLVELSKCWPLRIARCALQHERLCLFLNKIYTYETVLHSIFSQGSQYGKIAEDHKKILLTADSLVEDEWLLDMTDYRRRLLKDVLGNLLTETGHSVISEMDADISSDCGLNYHISSKPPTNNSCVHIYCGAVTDCQKKCKIKDALAKDYLSQKCKALKEMSRHKHGPQVDSDYEWEKFFRQIGEATLRIQLLSIRPSRSVSLNFQEDNQETSRSAQFILYNCARLAALQDKYDKNCLDSVYPPMVSLEKVDFSLLTKEEEWELLSNYILMYPHVLQNSIEFIDKGKPMPNLLCQFLQSLCGCFSGYYRRVRVLTEPRDHMLPVMFARLYLLKAVEHVLHNGLRILGVEPVRYM